MISPVTGANGLVIDGSSCDHPGLIIGAAREALYLTLKFIEVFFARINGTPESGLKCWIVAFLSDHELAILGANSVALSRLHGLSFYRCGGEHF